MTDLPTKDEAYFQAVKKAAKSAAHDLDVFLSMPGGAIAGHDHLRSILEDVIASVSVLCDLYQEKELLK